MGCDAIFARYCGCPQVIWSGKCGRPCAPSRPGPQILAYWPNSPDQEVNWRHGAPQSTRWGNGRIQPHGAWRTDLRTPVGPSHPRAPPRRHRTRSPSGGSPLGGGRSASGAATDALPVAAFLNTPRSTACSRSRRTGNPAAITLAGPAEAGANPRPFSASGAWISCRGRDSNPIYACVARGIDCSLFTSVGPG